MRLRQELEREAGVSSRIRWGGLGQFDVRVDGRTIFSKKATGRVPEPGEIARLIRQRR